jgi:hypothetical protein
MRKLFCVIAAGLLVFGVACGGGDDESEPAANEQEETTDDTDVEGAGSGEPIEVAMTEFAFDAPETIPAGEVEVVAINVGEQEHEMGVIPLTDDAPPVEDLLKLSNKELEQYTAGPFGGTNGPIPAADQKSFTLNGESGQTFAFACFIPDPESKKPHALLGMYGSFTVE